MKQTGQSTSEIRCKNCGGNYDPSAPTCPFCGEDTTMNTASSSVSLLDEARYGGGFGEKGVLRKVMGVLLALLLVGFVCGAVWLGMDTLGSNQPAELDNPTASSGAASSAPLPADPDASQTEPEQSGTSQTQPEQPSQVEPEPEPQPEPEPEPDLSVATALSISASSLSLEEGESQQLTATVAPEGWTGSVIWSSSDQSVATVDNTGRVSYVSGGSCTITAEAGSLTATCAVQCAKAAVPSDLQLYYTYLGEKYTDITLNNVGDGFALEVSGGTGTYQWSTSNAAVATVTDGGSVYATGSGRCTITVTSGDASASVSVRVK